MRSATSVHESIRALLTEAGIYAVDGPASDLPVDDGRVAQAAVLWPDPGAFQHRRMVGASSGRADKLTLTCVGATALDVIALAEKVHKVLDGVMLSDKGGTLQQTMTTSPAPEPNSDPVRVSCQVEYTAITKGRSDG